MIFNIAQNREEFVKNYIYYITCNVNVTFDLIRNEIERIIDTNIGEEVVKDIIEGVTNEVEELKKLKNEANTEEEKEMIDEDINKIKNILTELSSCIKKISR